MGRKKRKNFDLKNYNQRYKNQKKIIEQNRLKINTHGEIQEN